MPTKQESTDTSNARRITLKSFYGGEIYKPGSTWQFCIDGVTSQECYLFGVLLQHIVDNYDDIMQTLHDGDGGLILAVKA